MSGKSSRRASIKTRLIFTSHHINILLAVIRAGKNDAHDPIKVTTFCSSTREVQLKDFPGSGHLPSPRPASDAESELPPPRCVRVYAAAFRQSGTLERVAAIFVYGSDHHKYTFPFRVCAKSLVIWTHVAVLVNLTIADAASSSLFRRGCQLADSRSYAAFHSWSEVELSQFPVGSIIRNMTKPFCCVHCLVLVSLHQSNRQNVDVLQRVCQQPMLTMEVSIFLYQLVPT